MSEIVEQLHQIAVELSGIDAVLIFMLVIIFLKDMGGKK